MLMLRAVLAAAIAIVGAVVIVRMLGQGLHFEPVDSSKPPEQTPPPASGDAPTPPKGRPSLKVVK